MYLSTSDGADGADIDDNSQTRQGNTSPVPSAPSPLSFPSCNTLLVIDDNSTSNDSSLNTIDIPSTLMPSSTLTTNSQVKSSSPLPITDAANDTPDQQRRRNSSIAKLLGGQPLNNQQYEGIHQQILDDRSTQLVTNSNDNGTDSGIPRSRSSITRTLLMNAERNNNNASTTNTQGRPSSPEFSKSFEYLIRRELDIEHAPSTLLSNSAPSVFQNLSSARNTPPANAQSPSQSKLKRKRPHSKQAVSTPPTNKSSNIAPFAILDPFELDSPTSSSIPPLNPTPIPRSHHHQNELFRFDASHRHHHYHPQHQSHHPQQQQQQQQPQYSLPMTNSPANSSAYSCHKLNSPVYAQFKIHHDRLSTTSYTSSPSYNCCRYPPTVELALPTPVLPLSSHASSPSTIIPPHIFGVSSRKTKTMHRPDMYNIPVQRSHSTTSNQSDASTSSSASSASGQSVPLKKRLLHAYKNEQRPSSSL